MTHYLKFKLTHSPLIRPCLSLGNSYTPGMIAAIEAIYEDGMLRPLQPIALPEHTHVRISLETIDEDPERAAWLGESARRLRETWDNADDDAYNALLTQ